MKSVISKSLGLALALALTPATSPAQDPGAAAAERARLANQRIQAEAVRRAEEERALEAEAAMARTPAPDNPEPAGTPTGSQPSATAPRSERSQPNDAGAAGLSLALEQLRTLGELKDAGYVTEEEFERIKQRILDNSL
ncbi:MAG: SHOCT domain-containing protein [Pseudomonadota bacterium]